MIRRFPPVKRERLISGYFIQGITGQYTHPKLNRLQIVSVRSLRDHSTTQNHRQDRQQYDRQFVKLASSVSDRQMGEFSRYGSVGI